MFCTKKDLMKNKTLINNMNYIFNFLILNCSLLNGINKNILLKHLSLEMLLMNYLKIDLNLIIDINEIFLFFEGVNNKVLFNKIFSNFFWQKKLLILILEIFKTFIEKKINLINGKKENFTHINFY